MWTFGAGVETAAIDAYISIDDIAFSEPCIIWSECDDNELRALKWQSPQNAKYKF